MIQTYKIWIGINKKLDNEFSNLTQEHKIRMDGRNKDRYF